MLCSRPHLWSLVVALLFLQSAPSFAGKNKCLRRIDFYGQQVLRKAQNHLLLPPQSSRYVIGALVRTEDRKSILAIAGYRLPHSLIESALQTQLRAGNIKAYRYEWLGELYLENKANWNNVGQVSAANETASLFLKLSKLDDGHENSIENLQSRLKHSQPKLLRRGAVYLSFEDSEKLKLLHLMPGFDRIVEEVEMLDDNYRHYIRNKISGFLYKPDEIFGCPHLYPDPVKELHNYLNQRPMSDVFELYLNFLENDGIMPAETRQLRDWMMQSRRGTLTLEEGRKFAEAAKLYGDDSLFEFNPTVGEKEVDLIFLKD